LGSFLFSISPVLNKTVLLPVCEGGWVKGEIEGEIKDTIINKTFLLTTQNEHAYFFLVALAADLVAFPRKVTFWVTLSMTPTATVTF